MNQDPSVENSDREADAQLERTVIGRVRSHRGSNGTVTLQIHPDDAELWKELPRVWVPGSPGDWRAVEEIRPYKDKLILKLAGVESIEQASALRGLRLEAARCDLPGISDEEYWIEDLIGSTVIADGEPIGVVRGFIETGGTDLLRVESAIDASHEILVPLNKEIISEVDSAARTIHAQLPEGLLELNTAESDDAADDESNHGNSEDDAVSDASSPVGAPSPAKPKLS